MLNFTDKLTFKSSPLPIAIAIDRHLSVLFLLFLRHSPLNALPADHCVASPFLN